MKRIDYYLVLDAGTTTMRAMAFSKDLAVLGKASRKLGKTFPKTGWVEQNPVEMARLARKVIRQCVGDLGLAPSKCLGLGVTNQRETTVLWDEQTGRAVYPAIVWEDTRTRSRCRELATEHGAAVREVTGLNIDPYFSATKISWILAHVPRARALLEQGRLRFGTVDSWLIWNLCEGNPHVTDITNAHRTLLVSTKKLNWDDQLLSLFKVPGSILPEIRESRAHFGNLEKEIVGHPIPVRAVCGDQQSSLYAAWRFSGKSRVTKVTFGTGTFVDQTAGRKHSISDPFYAIIVPHPDGGNAFGNEGKIAKGAKQVDQLLSNETKLRRYLHRLTLDADRLIRQLPKKPRELIVDGGVSRDGIVVEDLANTSEISAEALPIFDGTALGTAYLLSDHKKK